MCPNASNFEETKFLNSVTRALDSLISSIEEGNSDLKERNEKISRKLKEVREVFSKSNNLNFSTLLRAQEILDFERLYPILELGDKERDFDFWAEPIRGTCANFLEKWNIENSYVEETRVKYEKVLKSGFFEFIVRKGIERAETDVIKSIRFHLGRGRLVEEYMQNLVLGWLFEDLVKSWIETEVLNRMMRNGDIENFNLTYGAHDQKRIIKFYGGQITGEPDFRLTLAWPTGEKTNISLEVQRVKKSYIGEKNLYGEVKMQVPGHRKSVEREVIKRRETFIMLLVEEDKGIIGVSINPNANEKVLERKAYSYVWATTFRTSEEGTQNFVDFLKENL